MEPGLTELNDLYYKSMRLKYPSFPISYIAPPKFKETDANGLTRCVIAFLTMSNHQAERINSMGRVIDNTKTVKDILGNTRRIGSTKYIPSNGTVGTADIHCVIFGRAVKVEIKVGKDVQSEAQKEYQQKIEAAGGIYLIIKDFQSFYEWYNLTFTNKQDGL